MRRALDERPGAVRDAVVGLLDDVGRALVVGARQAHAGHLDVLGALADVPVAHLARDDELARALHDHVALADPREGVLDELRVVLLVEADDVTLVVLVVGGLRLGRAVVAGTLGLGDGVLHLLGHEADEAVRLVQPGLDADGRAVDDEGVHAGVVAHHAVHAQHAAPRVAEQVDVVQAQRLAHGVELVRPEVVGVEAVVLVRDGRLAAADLVVEDDLAPVALRDLGVRQQVVVAVARTAVQHEQRLLARRALAEDLAVGLVALVRDVDLLVSPELFHADASNRQRVRACATIIAQACWGARAWGCVDKPWGRIACARSPGDWARLA